MNLPLIITPPNHVLLFAVCACKTAARRLFFLDFLLLRGLRLRLFLDFFLLFFLDVLLLRLLFLLLRGLRLLFLLLRDGRRVMVSIFV